MLPFKSLLDLKFGIQSYGNIVYSVLTLFAKCVETQNAT